MAPPLNHRPRLGVLTYHHVGRIPEGPGSVTADALDGHLKWLARLGFTVAPNASWALRMPIAFSAGIVTQAPGQFIDLMATQMSRTDREILARPEIRALMTELTKCGDGASARPTMNRGPGRPQRRWA